MCTAFGTRKARISHSIEFNLRQVINNQSISRIRMRVANYNAHGHNNFTSENYSEHENIFIGSHLLYLFTQMVGIFVLYLLL